MKYVSINYLYLLRYRLKIYFRPKCPIIFFSKVQIDPIVAGTIFNKVNLDEYIS